MVTVSPDEMTDIQLLQRIADGDHQAFRVLFDRYRLVIYRYCVLMLNDRDAAEDIYQETFVAFFEKGKAGEEICNVKAFLITVARRRCLNAMRKDQYSVPLTDSHLVEVGITQEFDQIDLEMHLRKALVKLPVQYREAFLFFEVEGYSYEEIAEYLGVSFNVVKNRIYRAKKSLQDILGPIWKMER